MIQHHPKDLGTAVYRALSGGRSPNTEPSSFADALKWFVKAAGGNVSAAARLAGVPRRSFRDWMDGKSSPGQQRRDQVAASARLSERRARVTPGREKRLRGRASDGIVITGSYNYDPGPRKVAIGQYMADGVIDDLLDAYLNGAQPDELREIFAVGITDDPSGFYASTMDQGPTDTHGWTVDHVTL